MNCSDRLVSLFRVRGTVHFQYLSGKTSVKMIYCSACGQLSCGLKKIRLNLITFRNIATHVFGFSWLILR